MPVYAIALKHNKVYQIQVKTRTKKNGKVLFQFRKDNFDKLGQMGYYVILVIRNIEGKKDYIIMPGNVVTMFATKGFMDAYKEVWRMWIGVWEDKDGIKQVCLRWKSNTITEYLNNWDLIK